MSESGYQEADILAEFLEKRVCFRLQANIPVLIGMLMFVIKILLCFYKFALEVLCEEGISPPAILPKN